MRYPHTTSNCLKPQSLFRSALSPSRASSPAARFQWTDVDTPERYPAIHFKNGHVTCYVMLGHIRLYYNHEAMSNAVKRCQMLQTQSSWRLEKSFVFRCFQINWSTPLKTLTQSCVQGRPGIARVTLKKKTQILKWKLFPVDQWIDWGGKILTGNNGLHMILPWKIGVSCRFPIRQKLMNQLTENISESGRDHCWICRNNMGFRSVLDQMGVQHQEPSTIMIMQKLCQKMPEQHQYGLKRL